MKLIFIYGLPATGKYTVAKELAALTGIKLFHNHQVVDMLLSVFDFGSEPFVALREDIWLSVFEEASAANLPALIFTFNPENSVSPSFIPNVIDTLTQSGSQVDFVELHCPLTELKTRMDNASRQQHKKLTSVPPLRAAPRRRRLRHRPHAQAAPLHRHQQLRPSRSRRPDRACYQLMKLIALCVIPSSS